jgi:hypothetical protein
MRTLGYLFIGILIALGNFAAVSVIYDQPPPIVLLFGVAIGILVGGMLVDATAQQATSANQRAPQRRKRRRKSPTAPTMPLDG